MKRRVPALLAGLLLIGLVPGAVLAANPANIDQQSAVGGANANDGGHTFAQTFTTGKTGQFSSVDLWLGGSGSVTVNIEAVDGSHLPTGSSLASGTGTIPGSAGWTNFAFGTPLSVTPGTMYAIVFVLSSSQFAYGSDNGSNAYADGVAYWLNGATWTALGLSQTLPTDEAFRTYVDPNAPPAPGATAPPTSTAAGSSSAAGPGVPWFLPVWLLAALCGLMVMATRTRRRLS
jgi:hypothetical protein